MARIARRAAGGRPTRAIAVAVALAVVLAGEGVLAAASEATASETAPIRPSAPIAVIGDFGCGDADEAAVARLVAGARPLSVITTGDNVYDSADYARLVAAPYAPWVRAGELWPATGNHDHHEGIEHFDAAFPYLKGARTYAVTRTGVEFLILDSQAALDDPAELQRQRQWVHQRARSSKARWQVAVLHHPPYSSGAVHGSTREFQWPFAKWGIDLVLSGHDHDYERIARDGISYVVDGSGGKDLYPFGTAVRGSRTRNARDHGALFLTPSPAGLVGEFWSADGRRLDRFVIPSRR